MYLFIRQFCLFLVRTGQRREAMRAAKRDGEGKKRGDECREERKRGRRAEEMRAVMGGDEDSEKKRR